MDRFNEEYLENLKKLYLELSGEEPFTYECMSLKYCILDLEKRVMYFLQKNQEAEKELNSLKMVYNRIGQDLSPDVYEKISKYNRDGKIRGDQMRNLIMTTNRMGQNLGEDVLKKIYENLPRSIDSRIKEQEKQKEVRMFGGKKRKSRKSRKSKKKSRKSRRKSRKSRR